MTREDGTYVMLKYDAALRLTNEIYYTAGGVPQTTNSYCFDASGSRIRLVKGGTTLTNAVSAGYRITTVKNGMATVESYTYDNGGRVTGMTRDGVTRSFGYNSADQVTAATNGASWITYRHDASGRRTISTNSAGTVRRFMVAPTPETDLESPHLIANAAGTIHQGYVYLGDDPILRYTGSGTAGYYLEDGMGSVIGLAPSSSPSTANTTRLFYDGFGNTRATNGPAPTIPTGTGGDFRFHGAWLESDSGLYNMRAREYDPRLGRFTSRDPRNGVFQRAETLNPYVYAVSNPHVFTDPSGEFTVIEINASSLVQTSMASLRQVVLSKIKHKVSDTIFEAVANVTVNQLGNIYPPLGEIWRWLKEGDTAKAGRNFESALKSRLYGAIGTGGPISSMFWFYPGIDPKTGDADVAGLNCPNLSLPKPRAGLRYPDFILSEASPKEVSKAEGSGKLILIGDVKLSGNSLYNQYVKKGLHYKPEQFDAITRYAQRHTYTRTAVFLTVFTGQKSKLTHVRVLLAADGLKKGVAVIIIAAVPNARFNDLPD